MDAELAPIPDGPTEGGVGQEVRFGIEQGDDLVDGEHCFIADAPEAFAKKTVRLLTDQQLYRRIAANGRQLVETRHDWDKIAGRLMDVYAEL